MSPAKLRTRTGSWSTFERRFQPLAKADDILLHAWAEIPKEHQDWHRFVWTVVDDDGAGRLYVESGLHYVNRLDYLLCALPWSDDGPSAGLPIRLGS